MFDPESRLFPEGAVYWLGLRAGGSKFKGREEGEKLKV